MTFLRSKRTHSIAALLLALLLVSGCSIGPAAQPTPSAGPAPTAAAAVSSPAPLPSASPQPTLTTAPATALPSQPTPVLEAVAGGQSIGDAYIPELGNTGYDVQRYTLRMALDPRREYVDAHVTIEVVAELELLGQISLDFVGYEIEELSVDGQPAAFERQGRKLVVDLPLPRAQGQAFALDVIYRGTPLFEPSPYLPFFPHIGLQFPAPGEAGGIYAISEPDGARYWFPCNDHPRDKARFRFELGVPEGLMGLANGLLVESRLGVPAVFEDGASGDVYVWEHEGPMATYLATVMVGDYRRVEGVSPGGVPLRHYVFAQPAGGNEARFQPVGEMVDWMSSLLGNYPFEVFGFASVTGSNASMETQALVTLNERAGEYTMAHELAHMWFGNWVSLDRWGDMWRNEGFATYFGAMWSFRNDPGGLERYMAEVAESYQGYVPPYPLDQPPPASLFGRDSYMRGALLVHALRGEMGDEAFFAGLRTYLSEYGGGTASQTDFQKVMEAAAGTSLEAFFEEWLQ